MGEGTFGLDQVTADPFPQLLAGGATEGHHQQFIEGNTFGDVPGDETLARIDNDDLDAMRITVNGHEILVRNLKTHETRIVDMARWMVPGDDNTITFEARGPKGSSALVTVYPPPTGSNVLTTAGAHRKHKRARFVDLFD